MRKILVGLALMSIAGCADVIKPTAHYAMTHPLDTGSMVSMGTSRDEVKEKWGEPDLIEKLGYDDMGLEKESWTYNAWFPKAPLDYRHFSRDKKIYFTGGYVTGFEDIGEE